MRLLPHERHWMTTTTASWSYRGRLLVRLPNVWRRGKSAVLHRIAIAGKGVCSSCLFYPSKTVRQRGMLRQ